MNLKDWICIYNETPIQKLPNWMLVKLLNTMERAGLEGDFTRGLDQELESRVPPDLSTYSEWQSQSDLQI